MAEKCWKHKAFWTNSICEICSLETIESLRADLSAARADAKNADRNAAESMRIFYEMEKRAKAAEDRCRNSECMLSLAEDRLVAANRAVEELLNDMKMNPVQEVPGFGIFTLISDKWIERLSALTPPPGAAVSDPAPEKGEAKL